MDSSQILYYVSRASLDMSVRSDSPTPSTVRSNNSLLSRTNKLFQYVGIEKPISTIEEIFSNSSSMFVALIESLFNTRLEKVYRYPSSKADYITNAQLVVDFLSEKAQMELKNISGEAIVDGDNQSISNLVDILIEIVNSVHKKKRLANEASLLDRLNEICGEGLSKPILSTEEFCKNSSSIFVILCETIFQMRIENVNRNPTTTADYIYNAQLVIDYLEEHTHTSLGHIEGKAIVDGDRMAIFYLADILVRIVNCAIQDVSLSSIETSDSMREEGLDLKDRAKLDEMSSINTDSDSNPNPNVVKRAHTERLRLKAKGKLEAARERRERIRHYKESELRKANLQRSKVTARVQHNRWMEDRETENKAFAMRRQSLDHVALKDVYRGVMKTMKSWRIDEQMQITERIVQKENQWRKEMDSLTSSFQGQLSKIQESEEVMKTIKKNWARESIETHNALLKIAAQRNKLILTKGLDNLNHQREKELFRRSEAQRDNLEGFMYKKGMKKMSTRTYKGFDKQTNSSQARQRPRQVVSMRQLRH